MCSVLVSRRSGGRMKKRNHKRAASARRRTAGLAVPRIIHNGIVRANREASAWAFCRPMRNVLMQLRSGVVDEIAETGEVFIDMATVDSTRRDLPAVVPIGAAIHGWICVCERLDDKLKTYRLRVLADRLNAGQEITERLVEQAREEFDDTVRRIVDLPDGAIKSAVMTTQIAWEVEKLSVADNAEITGLRDSAGPR